jgi:polysaccharide export outer membrane protein
MLKRTGYSIWTACLAILLATCLLPAGAQQAPASDSGPAEPQLKLSPQKQLEKFEPAANEEYQLGPGDEISLDFPGRPELSSKHVVGPDGRITLPLAGALTVADLTREQVAETIAKALSAYYTNPVVTVRIDKYGSNRVLILGNVQHPGVLYFDETPTLLDVIARGGLMTTTSSAPNRSAGAPPAVMDGIPERCMIYRGKEQVVQVDLRLLLTSGNPLANLRLRRNDIVFVPAQQELYVSVLGEVKNPGAIPLRPDSTLATILSEAGGPGEGAGNSPNIQIIQPSTGKQTTVSMKNLMSLSTTHEITLHPGDMIFVPKSGFYKATWVLQRLSPIATMVALGALIAP